MPTPSSIRSSNNSVKSNKSATLSYLTSYESMVRGQDDECDRTRSFLREAARRLRRLGGPPNNTSGHEDDGNRSSDGGMLTYREMRRALLRLGCAWNRSANNNNNTTNTDNYYDDDDIVSLASEASLVSGTSGRVLGGKQRKRKDVVATDNQLVMLLSILVETEERWRCGISNDSNCNNNCDNACNEGLFLPELMQAYKLVIGGMQSLQSLRREDSNYSSDDADEGYYAELSERIRERTKRLLRSFGPDHEVSPDPDLSLPSPKRQSSGRSRDGLTSPPSSPSKQLFSSDNRPTQITTRYNNTSGSSRSPSSSTHRLPAEDSLRQLMYTKDATLAKIVEENQYEMEALSHDLEHLKEQERNVRRSLTKRRKRTRYMLVAVACAAIAVTGYGEHRRRAWVHRQITSGREEERLSSIREMERLTLQRDALRRELDTAEGTARYQHARLTELEVGTDETMQEIALLEQKLWLGQTETGRCRVLAKETEEEISSVRDAVRELEEESSWCSNRLKGRDAELNSLRYSKDSTDDYADGGHNNRGLSLISSFGGTTAASSSSSSTDDKPVKLEMKYNASVRNAMMLRQIYSGAGGIAASVVLRAAFPQLFTPISGIASKKAVAAAASAPKKSGFNIKWVDRVHAATVVLLVVRTAVLFFLP